MRRRLVVVFVLVAAALAIGLDVSRTPSSQWTTAGALGFIRVYRQTLSPLLAGSGYVCRFTPTCSRYAEAVLKRDGFVRGGWKTAARLARCGPWTPLGTIDTP
ncbi:MAG: membrane protein insertion efficiency factor YidD [Vicinamibacterales bacterium]